MGGTSIISSTDAYTLLVAIGDLTCCFIAGTQVLTSLDGTTTPIEMLKNGDTVVSYNIETGENYLAVVNKVIVKENVTTIAEVYFDNGTVLTMNEYHPILTKTGWHSITNYKGYDTLEIGDIAKIKDGWSKIIDIKRYYSDPVTMFTLAVSDIGENPDNDANDSFYANGIVVHNAAFGECEDMGSGDE